ncbi:MAG: hypothetical protein Q8M16_13685 [Pirellulaceae bacterium]|nr:hypothetical protein [Pirellulaceae bacterium]
MKLERHPTREKPARPVEPAALWQATGQKRQSLHKTTIFAKTVSQIWNQPVPLSMDWQLDA